ncbi:MAG TPA: crotonase/enoyl-CoA hydratase family protein [Conexibacter sp.]|jgi:enoyl-CoA hydratase
MDEVLVERAGRVLVVTVNRPQARNAINLAVSEGIMGAMRELDADDALAVGVLTGAGGYFSAGMDLKAFASGGLARRQGEGLSGTLVYEPPAKPLIAAVEGLALAGGLELALACDMIVAARGARLGLPEVKRGLTAAGGGLTRLPQRIPRNLAMEMVLTGDPITAERAAELGLVNTVVDPGDARAAALALATRIAENAPLALAASKRVVDTAPGWPADEVWARQDAITAPVRASRDAQEGARAFAERRAAQWEGR